MEFSKEYAVQMQDITIRFGSHCALNKVQYMLFWLKTGPERLR